MTLANQRPKNRRPDKLFNVNLEINKNGKRILPNEIIKKRKRN